MFPIKRFVVLLGLVATAAHAVPPSQPPFKTSQINVDAVTNQAATSGPNFLNGLDISEIATPASPGAGKLRVYGKSDDNLYFLNSSANEVQVGSGSGEKNYITSPSTAAGWGQTSGVTVATVSGASTPRPITTKTAFLVTRQSGSTAFAYSAFTLDDADFNKKLKVVFDQRPNGSYVSGDQEVDVYSCTVAWSSGTCGGTSTRLALSTDSSSLSLLPNLTGTYRTTFDTPGSAAKFIQVQLGLHAATASSAVAYSDLVVGPGTVTQGAVVEGWKSYTPTTHLTNTTATGAYRRVGSEIQVHVNFTFTGTPAGSYTHTVAEVLNGLGLTLDTSKPASTVTVSDTCNWYGLDAGVANYAGHCWMRDSINIIFGDSASATSIVSVTNPWIQGTSDSFTFDLQFPIAEWAGSGTVNVVQNDVEYAYNTDVTDASNTTSFGYGPAGVAFTPATAIRNKRVQFLTPISATDQIVLEVQYTTGPWIPLAQGDANTGLQPLVYNGGANTYGLGFDWSLTGTNYVTVAFGKYMYPSGATWAAAGTAWNTSFNWRVKKFKGGAAVGFSAASATASGLLSYEDSGSFSASFTGARSTTDTIKYSRVGKTVTLSIPRDISASCSNTAFTASTAIPAALRPSFPSPSQTIYPIFVQDNAATQNQTGTIAVLNTGDIVIGKSSSASAFTNAANCGWFEANITYLVN